MNPIARMLSRIFSPKAPDSMPRQPRASEPAAPDAQPAPSPAPSPAPDAQPAQKAAAEPPAPGASGENAADDGSRRRLTIPERRDNLIAFAVNHIMPQIEAIPETGAFSPVGVGIQFPGTENVCQIVVEPGARDKNTRTLIARAFRKGTDLAVSHFVRSGVSRDEIIAFLKSEAGLDELQQSFTELSDAVDDKW